MRYARYVCLGLLALPCLVSSTLAVPITGSLVMRYDASVVTTTGSNVNTWNNLGSAGATLNANAVATPPTLITSGPNNQPMVRFTTGPAGLTTTALQTGALGSDLSQPLTILHVGLVTRDFNDGAALSEQPFYYDGRISTKRAAYYHGSGTTKSLYAGLTTVSGGTIPIDSYNSWAAIFNGASSYVNQNGTPQFGPLSPGTNVIDGLTIGSAYTANSNRLDGDIGEILVYNRLLNAAELKILTNHFSAKYDLPVAENRYIGDDLAQGHYDFHVFGVGNSPLVTGFAAGTVPSGTDGDGLAIATTAGLDLNDYVMAGHKTTTNSLVMTDVGSGVQSRWDRVWYVDRTDPNNNIAATLTFDLSDAGITSPSNFYYLLYSSNNNFESSESPFTKLSLAGLVSGDQITFSLLGSQLADGYYTLGSVVVPEPSTFALLSLGLAGIASRRRGARRGR